MRRFRSPLRRFTVRPRPHPRIQPPRCTSLSAASLAAALALGLAACGSATATGPRSAPANSAAAGEASAANAPQTAGVADTSTSPSTDTPTSARCATAVAATLATVAQRIYHEASTGGDVAQAVHRVQSSSALAGAIENSDARAAHSALQALLLGQIVRVEVLHHRHVLASAGAGPAIAPVRGSIPGTGASFVLSVQSDHSYLQVTHQVTGAQVLLDSAAGHQLAGTIVGAPSGAAARSGPVSVAGRPYQAVTLGGSVYPSGSLRIALLVPARSISCPASLAQARVETLGHVGERIYQEELGSPYVAATVRRMEHTPAFVRAAATHDVAATQAAIVGFFRAHIHIVRVRVTVGPSASRQRLLTDVGGPYALAPVHGTLRSGGRMVGTFTTAIQDDAGYLKLAHLFTGADVLMRTGGRQVMGTLSPGPASVPARGVLSYRGRSYQAYSFTGQAFPSGPLQLSLLIAA